MEASYHSDKKFDHAFAKDINYKGSEFDNCTFSFCDLSGADFSGAVFIDCLFEECNLSSANLANSTFRDCRFLACKMLGLHFEHTQRFGLSLHMEDCTLDHSSFYKTVLRKSVFSNCEIKNVDFTDADLAEAALTNCNLADAKFENTNLEKADLTASYNLLIDPEINRIRKAKFSLAALPGLLARYQIKIK